MLEKKEKVLQKKASAEVEKAKEFTRAKNKRGTARLYIILPCKPIHLTDWSTSIFSVNDYLGIQIIFTN